MNYENLLKTPFCTERLRRMLLNGTMKTVFMINSSRPVILLDYINRLPIDHMLHINSFLLLQHFHKNTELWLK